MPRMELSIKTDYLPNWGIAEGIRELVSNGRDAEYEFSAPMKIDWYNNTLRIENDGCILPREALLFGHTSKLGNSEMVGKFGEGLKLAVLCLIRAGHQVKIRSGSEVWEPCIERSEKFNANVLVFRIAEGRKLENRVRVEIGNITKEAWLELRERFLFLTEKTSTIKKVVTDYGTILLDPSYAGKIFIKGVYVQTCPDYAFGYDLANVSLDRDRKMVETYSLRSYIGYAWSVAVRNQPELMEQYFSLFLDGKGDVAGVTQSSASCYNKEMLQAAAAKFTLIYGENAFPVATLEQSRDLEHLGKKGIVLSPGMVALLSASLGSLEELKGRLEKEVKRVYSWDELTEEEQMNILYATDLLEKADPNFSGGLLDVVDFLSTIEGLYQDGRLKIAHRFLQDRCKLLQILLHEYAHHSSLAGDGEFAHVDKMQNLWMEVVRGLWK